MNISESVCLLHFPTRIMRILGSLRFRRLCSLCSASVFFSLCLVLCFSAALLSFCEASASETLIAIRLCHTFKASRPLPAGYEIITHGFVRVFAFLQVFRRSRLGVFCLLFLSSLLLLRFFSFLFTSNFASGHHTITPSYHPSFASPSLARRNAQND